MDFALFQKTIQAYYPSEALAETKKMKVGYYNMMEEYTKCLNELADCISNPAVKLKASNLSSLIISYAKLINEQNRNQEFIQKISNFKLQPTEQKLRYHVNLALFAVYLSSDNAAGLKSSGNKILADAYAPEEIKTIVRDTVKDK